MADRKKSTLDALESFSRKDLKEIDRLCGRGRKNSKPEKLVEADCMAWAKSQGWELQIYESKSVNISGVWRSGGLKAGHADAAGLLPCGTSVALEFKAIGKLSTFNKSGNERQKDFIIKRIHMNGFAVVVDSVERLKSIYMRWSEIRAVNPAEAKHYLLSMLP